MKNAQQSVLHEHQDSNALVESMLALHKKLASAKTPHRESIGKESVQRQVEPAADGAIDKLVYELP